jgi:hypothetical protein
MNDMEVSFDVFLGLVRLRPNHWCLRLGSFDNCIYVNVLVDWVFFPVDDAVEVKMIKGVFGLGILEGRIYFFFLNYRSYNIE